MNDSYNRCLQELRARYRGRGFATNMKTELELQAKEEQAEQSEMSYLYFGTGSRIADSYRSGVYNGSKYMTSDDFVRYFKSRRAFNMPSVMKAREAEALEASEKSTSVARRTGHARNGALTPSENAKEGHLETAKSVIKAFREKWFPMERREGRREGVKFRVPAAAMSGIAVFAVSLGLVVGGSVMIGSASSEVGLQRTQIAKLEAEQADLQGKLDLKYNVSDIEAEAKSLGMIKRQYAENSYIRVNDKEEIIIYEDENEKKEPVGLAALLSSFGIELDS